MAVANAEDIHNVDETQSQTVSFQDALYDLNDRVQILESAQDNFTMNVDDCSSIVCVFSFAVLVLNTIFFQFIFYVYNLHLGNFVIRN